MRSYIIYTAGSTPALDSACTALSRAGGTLIDHPSPEITHLLLPVPSFEPDGRIKGGGNLQELLQILPENVTVIGGNLSSPLLSGHPTIDLLQDVHYVSENAAITAHCALKLAMNRLPVVLAGCEVLVIGWGRIGKCLAALLKGVGAKVTVAARKEADRAMLHALGYGTEIPSLLHRSLHRYRVIFNTAPAPVLSAQRMARCQKGCLEIDLASRLGLEGEDVIWARGLPGKDAPESSGRLIAETVIRLLEGKTP